MNKVLIVGAGKIGTLIACLLNDSDDYEVHVADKDIEQIEPQLFGNNNAQMKLHQLDVTNEMEMSRLFADNNFAAVISSLPYFCNPPVARIAREFSVNYFDLTEDTKVTDEVKQIAEYANCAFVPQCGLAPGFISIAANELIKKFDSLNSVLMRVGALPKNPNNALKYSLTWSTDGLINEYGNVGYGIEDGKPAVLLPLDGLETVEIDGLLYEAFNTSGGLGSLAETYADQVKTMNYKTLRYPGHCEKMKLLMQDLGLNEDRETLKHILERNVPKTLQDVVIVYAAVTGTINGELYEETYVNKVYPQEIAGKMWSAIQVTTAAGVASVVDVVLSNPGKYQGFVKQESFSLSDVTMNRFGKYYA